MDTMTQSVCVAFRLNTAYRHELIYVALLRNYTMAICTLT